MRKFLAIVVYLAFTGSLSAQLVINSTNTVSHGTIWFYQYKPPTYNNTSLFPLIISLHGGGSAGTNFPADLPRVLADGLPQLVSQGNQLQFTYQGQSQGFLMLAPQCKPGEVGNWPPFYVDEMIKYAIANLRADPARIFLTGGSNGGGGTWEYAASSAAAASKLAGIAPGSSTGGGSNFCNIAANKVAVWAFAARDDNYVGPGPTINNTNAVNNCNPKPIIPAVDTIFQYGQHGVYMTQMYNFTNNNHYPNVFQWMMRVNRNINPYTDQAPVPKIAGGPVINRQTPFKVSEFPVLDGSGSTDDDIIMDYLWQQTSGPALALGQDVSTPRIHWPTTTVREPNYHLRINPGTYTFRLRVQDYLTTAVYNGINHTQYATLTVNVTYPASGHSAPVVDAGGSKTITTATTFKQNGAAEAYTCTNCSLKNYGPWTLVSKPAGSNPLILNSAGTGPYVNGNTGATFSNLTLDGVYKFQFAATTNANDVGTDILTITKTSAALPVTYAYINGVNNGSKNTITWATTIEENSARFDILRSTDGVNFSTAGSVPSKGGSALTEYLFDDNSAPAGMAYYRLSQVDKDGNSSLSKIVSVNNRKTGLYIEKYPNPVHDNLTVTVQASVNGSMQVLIADMQGKTILQQKWQKDISIFKKVINVAALQNGVYQMIVIVGQEKQVSSFVKY